MGRFHILRALALVFAVASVGSVAGCNPATFLWFLNRGDGKQPPAYPLTPKEKQEEVTVALLITASPTLPMEFAGVERELATMLSRKLVAESKDAKKPLKPIKVIEQNKVDKYLASNPNWKVSSPGTIAKGVGADYLLDISIGSISLYSSDFGREACQGNATLQVAVYDADEPGSPKSNYPMSFTCPASNAGLTAPAQYRNQFLEQLARKLAFQHVPHPSEMEIGSRLDRR